MGDSNWAAAVQMTSGEDKKRNLEAAERLVREAAERGARLVALPELFNCLGRKEHMVRAAEPVPGPTSRRMGDLARRLRITLLAGSLCERAEGRDRVFNTSLLFDDSGNLLARYRKIHLFDVNLPGRVSYQESSWTAPGRDVVSAETDHGHLGLSICYDLRFPELYRHLVRRAAGFCWSLRPFRCRRAGITGRSCCEAAPSRTRPTSSHPISTVSTRPDSPPAAALPSSIPGESPWPWPLTAKA